MDFKNVPNTNNYPIAPPTVDSFSGGVSAGAMDPQAYAGATINTDDAPKKTNKGIYIGIFAVFAIMTASSLGFFVYMNGQSARASSNENTYSALLSQPPVQPKNVSPVPTVALDQYSITLTPTPAQLVTIFPTLPNHVATRTPTPLVTITPIRGNKWAISFDKMTYTRVELPGNPPTGTGTLYTPIEYGKVFCIDTNNTFFTWKKNSTTIERLCDRLTPTPSTPHFTCQANSAAGTPISAALYPTTDCSSGLQPSSGTYVLYTRVHYDCVTDTGITNASTCKSTKDVFSDDFNLTNE